MKRPFQYPFSVVAARQRAFTLVEILVAMGVISLLLVLTVQIVSSTRMMTSLSTRRQEADSQARIFFGRMALDLKSMPRRSDLSYYFKSPALPQAGNDRLAFFSEVAGFYENGADPGAISLVAYRMSESEEGLPQIERMGKGLSWLRDVTGQNPVVYQPQEIDATWPTAASEDEDADYEPMGPGIFRFEYAFILKSGELSDRPWDTAAGSTGTGGLEDVAGLVVWIAVLDPLVAGRVDGTELEALGAMMADFSVGDSVTDLRQEWNEALTDSDVPPQLQAAVRIYARVFTLDPWAT